MQNLHLNHFAADEKFPFHIMSERHEESVPMHRHLDFHELVIVTGGTATHIVDNEIFSIKKGDVFVIDNGISHGCTDVSDFETCSIMFRFDSFFPDDEDIKASPFFRALFIPDPYTSPARGFSNRFSLAPDDYIKVYGMLLTIMNEYSGGGDGRQTMLRSHFLTLAVTLSRFLGSAAEEGPRKLMSVASTAAYIERHYTEKITLEELAGMSHYSPRHFVRIFEEAYRVTPQKYILSLRLRHACILLRETDISVEDTALQSGFGDGNYFSRVFRRHIGVTPREYRRAPDTADRGGSFSRQISAAESRTATLRVSSEETTAPKTSDISDP